MAGDAEHEVVVLGRHDLDVRPEQSPERREPFDRRRLDARRRGENAPAVDEELGEAGIRPGIFGAGDGVRRHEMHPRGEVGRHGAQDRAFDRADVRDDRSWRKVRSDLCGHLAARADRDGDNDEISAFGRRCVGFNHLIGEAELGHAPARGRRAGSGDDGTRSALRARGALDRRANETHSDQRKTIENGLAPHLRPMNSAGAATTSRFASSVPTLMRNAFGSLYALTRRKISPRWVRNASASSAVRPRSGGKWISTKLAMLGVTSNPSLLISTSSHARHFSLCARDVSRCALSCSAAMPAAIAGALTLNGPRMRWMASTTCAGP